MRELFKRRNMTVGPPVNVSGTLIVTDDNVLQVWATDGNVVGTLTDVEPWVDWSRGQTAGQFTGTDSYGQHVTWDVKGGGCGCGG